MMVRKLEGDEYQIVKDWFKAWTKVELSDECISDFGYVFEQDSRLLAAVFLFPTIGADMAFLGWPIANPEASKEERDIALDAVFIKAEQEAKLMSYKWLTTYSSKQSVEDRFRKHGYSEGDTLVTQFIKRIGEE